MAGTKQQTTIDSSIAELVPLLWEIGNWKRTRAAKTHGSLAEAGFRWAWHSIAGTEPDARRTAFAVTAEAIVSSQIGAIDRVVLLQSGLPDERITEIQMSAFDRAAGAVDALLRDELRRSLTDEIPSGDRDAPLRWNGDFGPPGGPKSPFRLQFVDLLARQPRSGATRIGEPRLFFDRPENHAEHSAAVAVSAVLLAPIFGADVETVFLASIAHHLHNAHLPDGGFAAEEMLGEHLATVIHAFREKCLAELSEDTGTRIKEALDAIESAETPEGKAFHAADVLDRVLQMRHHAETGKFTLERALGEMGLVHAGPVQQFHEQVLAAAGLHDDGVTDADGR